MSSSSGSVQVLPGGGFVVELAALEAGVEDADPAVGELPQCLAVGFAAGAELLSARRRSGSDTGRTDAQGSRLGNG